MRRSDVLEDAFPSRIEAVAALRPERGRPSAASLRTAAEKARANAAVYGRAPEAKNWERLADALEIAEHLARWLDAVRSAESDAERYLRAARQRLAEMQQEAGPEGYAAKLVESFARIGSDISPSDVEAICRAAACVPMPLGVYADPGPDMRGQDIWERKQREKPPELTVAFLQFLIDGKPAKNVEWLTPGEAHDLEIEVRVSRWPEGARTLVIEPVTIERPGTFDLPAFAFSRPSGDGPYLFQQRGRMILNVPQGVQAKPFEFAFAAEFEPSSPDDSVSLAGQRRLRLDGSSSPSTPLTGYPAIDVRIWDVRNFLRAMAIPEDDITNVLAALVTIGNLMGSSTQDAIFTKPILEKEFQAILRDRLRQNHLIGRDVDPEPHVAGGRADLSFRGMRIELKSERNKRLEPADCKKYAAQAASYAVGTGRRVAILCVLDCSPKTQPPFPSEDGLYVDTVVSGGSPVLVVTCLVQGNLPSPSSHSR